MNDYAEYRQSLPVNTSPGVWAGHYGPGFLGSLSSPVVSVQAIYRLCVPFGFSHDVMRTEVVWEAAPFVFGATLKYLPLIQKTSISTWQSFMSTADDGSISLTEKTNRPLGLPNLDRLLAGLGEWRLSGNTYPFSEAVLAAVRRT